VPSPLDLQRNANGRSFLALYFQATFFLAAALLGLHTATTLIRPAGHRFDPILLGIEGSLALFAAIGSEIERNRSPNQAPVGWFLATLGALQAGLCVRTGGLSSPYFVTIVSTGVFAGLTLGMVRATYVTGAIGLSYVLGVRFLADSPPGMDDTEIATAITVHVLFLVLASALAGHVARRQRQTVATLAEQSMRDPLTSLENRRSFMKKMTGELHRAERFSWPITMLVIDLDHFKKMNDVHGHAAGDAVLVEVANLLRDTVPTIDHIARVGGEEFAVAAVAAEPHHGRELADRLVRAFRGHNWSRVRPGLKCTASIGIAVLQPGVRSVDPDTAIRSLLERADRALYHVKQNGRDGYHVSGEEWTQEAPTVSAGGPRA
jgi:diguanylate cyclase (GGDEF)-like protein